MKKSMIKGMALLAMGFAFVACSHDTNMYDENFANKERVAEYNEAFTKAFGSIASGHQWGFDQTAGSNTRTAVSGTTNEIWVIPYSMSGNSGAVNSEGNNAKEVADAVKAAFENNTIARTLDKFDFSNYFLQHITMPKNVKNEIDWLEAYNSKEGKWEKVDNFEKGKDESWLTVETTYFYTEVNNSAKGATLMKDMGGNAEPNTEKMFRVKMSDKNYNDYIYDYGFLTYDFYDKYLKETVKEAFLGIQLSKKNGKGTTYWVIRLAPAKTSDRAVAKEGRVLCEDMGANDFDFNDVVFDARIMLNGDIHIEVLAHGGILPIKVAGKEVTLKTMSNTGVNTDDTQEIFIPAKSVGVPQWANIEDIPVEVVPENNADNTYNLEAPVGSAPQKICAPIGTRWPDEYIQIGSAYTVFDKWVSISDPEKWTFTVHPLLIDLDLSNNNE